jgi:cbb3-type cytochrome c oxidase subunit III
MSFRRVFVQSLFALAAAAAGPALAQTPPSEPAAAPAPVAETAKVDAHAGPLFGDAKTGESKAAVCGACHGMDGNPTDKQYPKLAGQNEAYIARQLGLFKSQKRQNPIMLGFAATLGDQDMHDVGAYFAGKTSLPGVADDALVERGQALYRGGDSKLGIPACMACHGPDGRGMAGAGFPQLAGQWTDYVATKLKDWKAGTTWGEDANAKVMPAIAQKLSDADITALASYVEGLHTAAGTSAAAK